MSDDDSNILDISDGASRIYGYPFNTPIESWSSFKKNITYIDCKHNIFTELPELPPNLAYLDCSYNNLEILPRLPTSLIYLDCSENNFSESFKEYIKEFDYCENNINIHDINKFITQVNKYHDDIMKIN
jgi:Leucine-rich repeat (LRR) protein